MMQQNRNYTYSSNCSRDIVNEDVMRIISKKVKSIRYGVNDKIEMGVTVSKKTNSNVNFSIQRNSCECVMHIDDKQQFISSHKVVGQVSNVRIATPITYTPDVPIYIPLYNSANDPYSDIFNGNINISVNSCEVLITTNNKMLMVENRTRGRKKSQLIISEENTFYPLPPSSSNSYHFAKPKSSFHTIKFSDGTTQNVISKSGSIPKDIDKAYREYNELKNITVECSKCHHIVYKNDTFNDITNNTICARCASGYDFNDLYDWSDKDKDEKGWIMCKRCHKKRGKPLNQFLKIDQKGLIIQNTCRNCLLKKCVQYIKDRPFCNSSITNKISPSDNNNSNSVLLVSQERQNLLELEKRLNIGIPTNNNNNNNQAIALQHIPGLDKVESGILNSKPYLVFGKSPSVENKDKNSTITLQQINNKIEEVILPTPLDDSSNNNSNEEPPPPPPPPPQQQQQQHSSSSQSLPIQFNPAYDEPLRTSVIEMERIQTNKSAKELKEQKGNKSIGFDPYEYEFKDRKRYVISKVGVLPQKLDEALEVYQYNYTVKIQCYYCRDVRLRNDCFIDKEGNYICFDCSLNDIKKSGELYDWADRESDPKAAHILCKRCHKKCGKTLDQFLKLDQKDSVIILNTCRNCLLKKNYDYKKNSEFSKPSHHSIYRSPVPTADRVSLSLMNGVRAVMEKMSKESFNSEKRVDFNKPLVEVNNNIKQQPEDSCNENENKGEKIVTSTMEVDDNSKNSCYKDIAMNKFEENHHKESDKKDENILSNVEMKIDDNCNSNEIKLDILETEISSGSIRSAIEEKNKVNSIKSIIEIGDRSKFCDNDRMKNKLEEEEKKDDNTKSSNEIEIDDSNEDVKNKQEVVIKLNKEV